MLIILAWVEQVWGLGPVPLEVKVLRLLVMLHVEVFTWLRVVLHARWHTCLLLSLLRFVIVACKPIFRDPSLLFGEL